MEEYRKTWPDIKRIGLTGQMHGILYLDGSGNALTTHFYNLCNQLVPEGAECLCTIMDYAALKLTSASTRIL